MSHKKHLNVILKSKCSKAFNILFISSFDPPMMSAMPRPSPPTVASVRSSSSSLSSRRRGGGTSRMIDSWVSTSLRRVDCKQTEEPVDR